MIFPLTSNKPILLVGNGARAAGASEIIYEFSDKTCIPVLTTMNAVDLVQDKDRIGFIGTYGNRAANMILNECDLVIAVGARLGLRQVGKDTKNFAPKAKLIRADIDAFELSRDVKEDEIKYQIDAKEFMKELLKEEIPSYHEWQKTCFKVRNLLSQQDREIGNLVIEEISHLLPKDPIVAVDVGQNECWSAQSLALKGRNGRILISGGYGSMGCGLPFAIGASISNGNSTVFCITGDGGLQMNIQELETVKRENIPIKILVLNNRVLGKISEIQYVSYDSRYAQTTEKSGYSVPDFQKVAEAYGLRAINLPSHKKIKEYKSWLEDDKPCLINIMLPEESLLIPKINWSSGSIEPKLEEDYMKKVKEIFKAFDEELYCKNVKISAGGGTVIS